MKQKMKRLSAVVIDHIVAVVLASFLAPVVTLGNSDNLPLVLTLFVLLYFLAVLGKDFAFKNASIGKRLLQIEIRKSDGSKLGRKDIWKRSLTAAFLMPIELLLIVTSNDRIGDHWAKTEVVSRNTGV